MPPLAYLSHSDCGLHDTGWLHPEHVGRLRAIPSALKYDAELFHLLDHRESRHASHAELSLAHDPAYVAMIEDWVTRGSSSPYALAPDEVVRRSASRSTPEATAAAEFELGQYLHHRGNHAAAIPHWRQAHRLHPGNWTYKRQAWNFEDPMRQGRTAAYDSSWYEDIKKLGAENYYPKIQT